MDDKKKKDLKQAGIGAAIGGLVGGGITDPRLLQDVAEEVSFRMPNGLPNFIHPESPAYKPAEKLLFKIEDNLDRTYIPNKTLGTALNASLGAAAAYGLIRGAQKLRDKIPNSELKEKAGKAIKKVAKTGGKIAAGTAAATVGGLAALTALPSVAPGPVIFF